ncbi:hypothetical protein [Roseomonas elaeocarpi]|uniref:Lipoprotein n=1 Tax=Roseomonas elaeocarpi TaxID=907779 RepID=A0ABV6JML4_9PROT
MRWLVLATVLMSLLGCASGPEATAPTRGAALGPSAPDPAQPPAQAPAQPPGTLRPIDPDTVRVAAAMVGRTQGTGAAVRVLTLAVSCGLRSEEWRARVMFHVILMGRVQAMSVAAGRSDLVERAFSFASGVAAGAQGAAVQEFAGHGRAACEGIADSPFLPGLDLLNSLPRPGQPGSGGTGQGVPGSGAAPAPDPAPALRPNT